MATDVLKTVIPQHEAERAKALAARYRCEFVDLKTTKIDLETGEGETVTDMQLAQNKAMFARIKYQALAIVVVAIILAVSR